MNKSKIISFLITTVIAFIIVLAPFIVFSKKISKEYHNELLKEAKENAKREKEEKEYKKKLKEEKLVNENIYILKNKNGEYFLSKKRKEVFNNNNEQIKKYKCDENCNYKENDNYYFFLFDNELYYIQKGVSTDLTKINTTNKYGDMILKYQVTANIVKFESIGDFNLYGVLKNNELVDYSITEKGNITSVSVDDFNINFDEKMLNMEFYIIHELGTYIVYFDNSRHLLLKLTTHDSYITSVSIGDSEFTVSLYDEEDQKNISYVYTRNYHYLREY